MTSPDDMWDGLDRFSKIQELNGRLSFDFQTFQKNTLLQLRDLDEKLQLRVMKEDFYEKQ